MGLYGLTVLIAVQSPPEMTFWTRNGREDGAAHGYRNLGIFWEAATNKILDDFVTACRPRRMHVTGAFTARGGITTTVVADYGRHGGVKRRGSSDALS